MGAMTASAAIAAATASHRLVVVRWLAAFRGERPATVAAWIAAAAYEVAADRDRAAEPLWRGRSILAARVPGIGLGYTAEAVRRVRSADCWSEPIEGSDRLTLARSVPRRAWRDWDAFARQWARSAPVYHAEAWIGRDARPCAVVVADHVRHGGLRRHAAQEIARRLRIPIVEVSAM